MELGSRDRQSLDGDVKLVNVADIEDARPGLKHCLVLTGFVEALKGAGRVELTLIVLQLWAASFWLASPASILLHSE
jgi:hypothetical protein